MGWPYNAAVKLSLVFQIFLARMAVGTLIALVPHWTTRPAERHLRFQVLLALVLGAGAAALYLPALGASSPEWPRGMAAFLSFKGGMPIFLVLMSVMCIVVNALFGTFKRRAGRIALSIAIVIGLGAVFGTARLTNADASLAALAAVALGGLLGGLLMASINDAMILGHFYLMIKGLPLSALRRAGRIVAIVIALKLLHFGGVLLFWGGASEILLGHEMVWTAWRVCFGFVGPITLLWMVKDTVRLQHTQAAAGLLYVAVGFALMGELAAVYLEIQTGIPA